MGGGTAASALGDLEGGRLLESALDGCRRYVRAEVGRLLPRLGPGGGPGLDERGEGWQRERLVR